ncbi:hypothetical protein KY285_027147 [Solanum tuberosum]|nr:hypothetical protein KY285_027147 [Solanum tuberosum]
MNKGRKGKYDPNVSCTHCGKTGHVYDNCFRRISFPDDFEFTKSRNFDSNKSKGFQGRANGAFKNEDTKAPNIQQHQGTTNANILDQLNKEQYAALVKQVAKDIKMEQPNTSAGGFTASAISGASEHMCFDSQFFTSLTPLPVPLHITLTNSSRIIVTHNGYVPILPNLTLENVLHVPAFKYNLLYVNRLCTQYACDILFTPNWCLLQGHFMKTNQVFCEVIDGLYLLEVVSHRSKFSSKNVVSIQEGSNSISKSDHVSLQSFVNVVYTLEVNGGTRGFI